VFRMVTSFSSDTNRGSGGFGSTGHAASVGKLRADELGADE